MILHLTTTKRTETLTLTALYLEAGVDDTASHKPSLEKSHTQSQQKGFSLALYTFYSIL